jgi:uncharacterized protein (TIGR02231 family)
MGEGGPLRIGSVESREVINEKAPRAEVQRLQAEIEALRDEEAALKDRLNVAARELELVQALIASAGQAQRPEAAPPPGADYWRQMLGLIAEGADSAYARQREAEQALRGVRRKLEKAEVELTALQADGRRSYSLVLNLEAQAAGDYELRFSYQVPGASWRPLYDARLDSAAGALTLEQLAEVRQASGEDWSDVALTLSTSLPARGGALPRLQPWFVDLQDPRALAGYAQKSAAEPSLASQELKREGALADEAAGGAGDWAAQLDASEFSAEWGAPGRASLPADGSAHKLRLEARSFALDLGAKIFPKIARAAYLVGEVAYDGEAPLLPGEVSIYRDGAYVGRQAFPMLRPGETRQLAFGLDDRISVEYRLADGQTGSGGLLSGDREERRLYAIRVENHHARPIDVEVQDQLPVPRHEDIEVALLEETTPPSERDLEDRKGLMAWRWTAKAGEARDIRFGYRVSFPEKRAIVGF